MANGEIIAPILISFVLSVAPMCLWGILMNLN